jgi:chemotaxis protein CheX
MELEYINPFVRSTAAVFSHMLSIDVTRETPFLRETCAPLFDVTGIIGLSGRATGTVAVSLSRETALAVTEILLRERPCEVNAQVVDAIGEVTNMIAGAAKSELESLKIMLSLPTVIIGRACCIGFPSQTRPICIPFDSPLGRFVVEVGIETSAQNAPPATAAAATCDTAP